MTTDKLPPHATETEQSVLGCCIVEPRESISLCLERLSGVESFYDLRHQTIYGAILEMTEAGLPVDLTTVRQRLQDKGQLESVGGVLYLVELTDSFASAALLPSYTDTLTSKHQLRRMVATCSKMTARIMAEAHEGDADDLLTELEKEVLAIRKNDVGECVSMKVHVGAVLEKKEADNAGQVMRGLPTGFRTLDRWTRGLKSQNLVVIAARPSVGKTSLALQMAETVGIEGGKPVLIFSLEMACEELTELLVNRRSRVNKTGNLSTDDFRAITAASVEISKAPLYIFDTGGLSIGQIQATSRRMHQRHDIELIVVDYLQLVRGSGKGKENRAVEIGEVSRGLKLLAKELKVPVVVLAQLNRDCEKENRPPRMSDLRESGSIEADADIVMLLHTTEDNGDFRNVDLRVEKNRGSRRGKIELVFNGPLTEFREVDPIERADSPGYHPDP